MSDLPISLTMKMVALAIPAEIRPHVTITGSLAAGQLLPSRQQKQTVRTKDIDCILSPHATAFVAGAEITKKLLESGWKQRDDDRYPLPWDSSRKVEDLPVPRLVPPGSPDWFLELLAVPEEGVKRTTKFNRIEVDRVHFVIPSFAFNSIVVYDPIKTDFGINVARPEMMALAHLLQHPAISDELIRDTNDKRSNKDLGRAVVLARLSGERVTDWPKAWLRALRDCFPDDWLELAPDVRSGIAALLNSEDDLRQACRICNNGLLAQSPITPEEFRASAKRLLGDAIESFLSLIGNPPKAT